eukprot:TRINITY_DN5842_c0_g1_i1.p2 TRINITY_DN5842_c0_g1~~TRINITY_DN5842_c0_g1_i1.p2  ORF type:complete len:219 (-),score=71.24 TRINITY_DN5842_c0_g1_i1:58-672(-)
MESVENRLFRVQKTLLQMLKDRDYLVAPNALSQTLDEFKRTLTNDGQMRASLTRLLRKRDDPSDRIFVFFPEDEKVGVGPIRDYCERMAQEQVARAIIVVQRGITPFAKQGLAEMSHRFFIEQFLESELLVNITEHELVPQHVPLSTREKAQLLTRYKCKATQLPRIQVTDPVARYYGLPRGTVVKIIRKSETSGRYVSYRLVV